MLPKSSQSTPPQGIKNLLIFHREEKIATY